VGTGPTAGCLKELAEHITSGIGTLNHRETQGIADPLKKPDSRTQWTLFMGFLIFLASSFPSTDADFAVRNYFFRTGVPRFLDFSTKNHPIIQLKVEFVQLLLKIKKVLLKSNKRDFYPS